ncbi:MAG: carboxypeptidase regulatory-like domain-containing protein [Deltaproteobacteria bacterium]|nr:carboxypeptidase regulatory-like domain-containing protein [Deltaproteobacteria bacterium]
MTRNRILLIAGLGLLGAVLLWIQLRQEPETTQNRSGATTSRPAEAKHASIRLSTINDDVLRADGKIVGQLQGLSGEQGDVRLFRVLGSEDQPLEAGRQRTGDRYEFAQLLPGNYCVSAAVGDRHGSACNIRLGPGETRERDIWLEATDRILSGTVRDAGGGTVAAPVIVAQRYPSFDAVWSAIGTEAGQFRAGLSRGTYRVTAVADGYTSATAYIDLSGDLKQVTHDFQLNPAGTISGVVRHADSTPAAGATVVAIAPAQPPQSVTADADGKFTITNLRPNEYEVVADLRLLTSDPVKVALSLGETEQIEVVLIRGSTVIEGIVVDASSRAPVATAEVRLRGTRREPVMTDQAGAFRFTDLVPGLYTVSVAAKGYAIASEQTIVGPDHTKKLELAVHAGGTIRGLVTGSTGSPVRGARILATIGGERDARSTEIRSDDKGRFQLEGVPSGRSRVAAYHEDHGLTPHADLEVPSGQARDVTLVFDSTGSVVGSVTYDDGAPAIGAIVEVRSGDASWRTAAGEVGRFRIEGLSAGSYYLTAWPRGTLHEQLVYEPRSSKSVELTAAETKTADLVVPGGSGTIRGTVVDDKGEPVLGAAVWAERVTPYMMSGTNLASVTTFTWNDGKFELTNVPRGEFRVYAKHVDYAEVFAGPVAPGAVGVVLTLAPLAAVEGRVLGRNGSPAPTFQLRWSYLTRSVGGGRAYRGGQRMVSDPSGRFRVTGLLPSDEYTLTAENPAGDYGRIEKAFSLKPGEQHTGAELRLKGIGRVKGRILDEKTGQPALSVAITNLSHRGMPTVDGGGRFDIDVVEGSYDEIYLQVMTESSSLGLPTVKRKFSVTAGEVTDLGDIKTSLDPKR